MPVRPDALFHPVYLSPRRALEANPFEPPPAERSEPFDGEPRPVPDRDVHLEHLRLDLDVDLEGGRIRGTAGLRLRPLAAGLAEIALDASELDVRGVSLAHGFTPFAPRAPRAGRKLR